ncbi:N(G),N(G)-dimethylarginine dimethylaminohydrolase 2-like [Takifugu rubripes]|uniref:DDAH family member 2, ADMA-independent n=3 Tax=Takifugu TaxID=31032 RepID=A0A674N5L7_TAKRU|nr:N(G),N(G)-dimethylarginine dimethylaminohydrolase 2 [Takifugu rubripes]XP_011607696.2 N(G),N(G)-dimethylarginine dimethylaminohydrolase 2 [Takifugu rubripes]XP_029687624.1 N(G),N(G)-dimethylarginine dimethylaminohydrolase 2-like [Takifugu rubripes]XP_029687625.1 N(G),N(G)-dimethylarginine dimethylaminohydrolase 2-like [Takifugu rubripes]XP_056876089.1 N(G),N(G)-dimethylarginine dimethylaminohydrolase 2 [Takifugu flavidus]XP_056876090.1 N(G),N(G)-dimethylarginine dimethylaminohydrolase 2 [Ta
MANMCPYGSFTHAVVRGIPETFGKVAGDGHENGEVSVDLAKAQRQFGCLAGALRQKVGLQLIEIPPDPELPESWRIEDLAVIQGGTALITRPFREQRRSEVEAVKRVVSELKLTVVEMDASSGGATLEGSDILFTGREFFVGISSHTNRRGAEVLADTFRDFTVSTVPVCGGARLKNICSMGGPGTIIISSSSGAKKTLRMMEQLTDHHYQVLSVPEESAANCIYIKGPSSRDFLLHRPAEECPDSVAVLQKLQDYTFLPTACSEASKLGAPLSSLCLLINRKHTSL